jgi:sulfur-oxidizing protein SoxY
MSDQFTPTMGVTRRGAMMFAAGGALAVVGAGLAGRAAHASAEATAKAVAAIPGGAAAKEGRITLDMPEIAENGNTVPMDITVESPMTAGDYVKKVHVFADGNPSPEVITFNFAPECGACQVSTRMRLAKTQNVVAVAEMSDGSVFKAQTTVKVTIGGCGG